jgi:hypothetical protein
MKALASEPAARTTPKYKPAYATNRDGSKSVRVLITLGAGALISLSSLAYADGPSTASEPGSAGSMRASESSMCTRADQVVFSCPLVGHNKVVSLCVSGDVTHGAGHFYYAFGRPGAPELQYPSTDQNIAEPFTYTHLMFAGGTGGYAYSFVNGQIKYIIYSVSGAGFDDSGVLVQRTGNLRAMADMKCQKGRMTETDDDALTAATLKWKKDDEISGHGLPHVAGPSGAKERL